RAGSEPPDLLPRCAAVRRHHDDAAVRVDEDVSDHFIEKHHVLERGGRADPGELTGPRLAAIGRREDGGGILPKGPPGAWIDKLNLRPSAAVEILLHFLPRRAPVDGEGEAATTAAGEPSVAAVGEEGDLIIVVGELARERGPRSAAVIGSIDVDQARLEPGRSHRRAGPESRYTARKLIRWLPAIAAVRGVEQRAARPHPSVSRAGELDIRELRSVRSSVYQPLPALAAVSGAQNRVVGPHGPTGQAIHELDRA